MIIGSITITSLDPIGNAVAGDTLIPVVNMDGVPTTQKMTVANLMQVGIGANLGDVSNVNIGGGTNGYVLQTDGDGNLSWTAQTGGGGNGAVGGANTQVQFNDAGDFGGNSGFTFNKTAGALASPLIDTAAVYHLAGTIIENADLSHGATSALVIPANGNTTNPAQLNNFYGNIVVTSGTDADHTKTWTFDNTGNFTLPGNSFALKYANGTQVPLDSVQSKIANGTSNVNIPTVNGNVLITSNGSSTWRFGTDGNLALPGVLLAQASDNGSIVFTNNGTDNNGSLKVDGGYNMVISADSNFYVKRAGSDRLAITDTNTDLMASSNVVIHANKAGTENNWVFGYNGTLTTPGNIRIGSTGNTGIINWDANSIGLSTDFGADNTGIYMVREGVAQMYANGNVEIYSDAGNAGYQWQFDNTGNLTLPTNTSSINYANGQPYGGGGGSTGNVTFNNNIVQGPASYTGLGLSASPEDTANLKYLQVRAGDTDSHIHFDTGDNDAYDQYFGNDSKFLRLDAGIYGNVTIGTQNPGAEYHWTFDNTGNTTVPGNIQSITTGFAFTSDINDVSTGSTTVIVTLTTGPFGGPVTGQVTITDVVGTTEANNTWYYQAVEGDQIQLYNDSELTSPVDGTTWTAYVSGGLAVSQGYSNLAITGGNVQVVTNDGQSWTFDNNGDINIPAGAASFDYGRIQSANGYPTLLGYGSGFHGGPELDWMNSDNPNDLGNANVIRHTMYINDGGFYVGMNENGNANAFSGSWSFGSQGSLTIPAGDANNINSGQIFSDNESGFINLDVQFASDVLGGVRLGTSTAKPVDIMTGDGSGGNNIWRFDDIGNLTLANGNSVIQSIANSSLDPANPNVSTMVFTPFSSYSSQALVLDPTSPGHIHLRAPSGNIDEPFANIFLGGENSSFEVGYYNGSAPNVFVHSGGNTWTFSNDGVLTTPGIAGNITGANVISANTFTIPGNTIFGQIEGPNTAGFYNSDANTIFLIEMGSSNTWGFNGNTGGTVFPQLSVQRGDNPSGTINGQTLLFDNASQEAIISTRDGDSNYNSSQRLVINPGKGADGTGGEGGDIYLWAGRGGDASGSGGDIKIRGGQGGANTSGGNGGDGGYIRIEAGDADSSGGAAGYIQITGGIAGYGTPGVSGGSVAITGGQGQNGDGGITTIQGGYGGTGYHGGNVQINGGGTSSGQSSEGNVNIQTGGHTWTFAADGTLNLPDSTSTGNAIVQSTSNIQVNANEDIWTFDNTGNLTTPGNVIVTATHANIVIGDATPSSGPGLSSTSSFNIVADKGGSNVAWTFSTNGNLYTPGNIITSGSGGDITMTGGNITGAGNISLDGGYISGGEATVVTDGINSIELSVGAQMDVYGFPFSGSGARGQLTITDVTTPAEANGTWYYQAVGTNAYQIYTDSTYSTPVDASGWSAYTGGGNVAITKQTPSANIVINSNGYLSTFDNNGTLNLPGDLNLAGTGSDFNMTGGSINGPVGVIITPTSFANLITPAAGARAFINDCNKVAAGNFGAVVGDGGSNLVPVWSDGVDWYIG